MNQFTPLCGLGSYDVSIAMPLTEYRPCQTQGRGTVFRALVRSLALGLVILASFSSGVAHAQKEDRAQPPPAYVWTVTNGCDESIRLALHYS